MKNIQGKKSHRGRVRIAALLSLAGIAGLLLFARATGVEDDADGDGIKDAFERFFGLSVGLDDSAADPDQDGLENLAEGTAGTDPFNADTDMDGWGDGVDAVPVSRAAYLWGEPRFTLGATNVYARPDWASFGIADGGVPFAGGAYAYGWTLEFPEDRLLMYLDRALVTNDLWLAVAATSPAPSFYSVGLLDSNLVALTDPVMLAEASAPWLTNRLPLSAWPSASVISIQSTQGVVQVVASVLYRDTDGDGLDDDQNAQLALEGAAGATNQPPAGTGGGGAVTNDPPATPERIGFETAEGYVQGDLNGQQGWTASDNVRVSAGGAFEGTQSVFLQRAESDDSPENTAVRAIGTAFSNEVVWVSVSVRYLPNGSRPPREELGAAAFVLDGNRVAAFDGVSGRWVDSARTFTGVTGTWVRVDFCLDYISKTYTLCLQGVAAHRNLGFADPSLTAPRTLIMQNGPEGDASLDAIVYSLTEPEGLDFDGDGLSNARERELGTEVWSSDSDGDGLGDAVEQAMGGDPLHYDADFDGDGLSYSDEVDLYGTDPAVSDTDGDGTPDCYLVADLAGSDFSGASGAWTIDGDALSAAEGQGLRAGYAVALPREAFYIAEITLSNRVQVSGGYHLSLYCDDALIAERSAPIPAEGLVWQIRTPLLPAGTNSFRLAWVEDAASARELTVRRVRVWGIDAVEPTAKNIWCAAVPATKDADSDGLPDAYETRVSSTAPTRLDTDGDGLFDGDELNVFRLDPRLADSGGDGTPDATAVASRAGVETAARYVTHITTDFTESGDLLVWADSTASSCAYDLRVETPGCHVLELSARNLQADPPAGYVFDFHASLLDRDIGVIRMAGDVDRPGKGRLITPWLPAGVHRFRISWSNRVVQGARVSRPALERVRLLAVNGADADGDGIQDWMRDRLLASPADSDGDGVKDRDEVFARHSNPMSQDSDGDGLRDNEEIAAGTSLTSADTDGDGVSDADEVRNTGTNPLTSDFEGGWTPVVTRKGGEYIASEGPWGTDISREKALSSGRGWVEYEFDVPAADLHLLRIEALHVWWATCQATEPPESSDFLTYVDGQFAGRVNLRAPVGTAGSAHALLPFLSAGKHRVRLFWNAIDTRLRLQVSAVTLGTFGGADSDGDGVRDWVHAAALRTNRIDRAVSASYISPVCVEGSARYPALASGVSGESAVTVGQGIAGRWYADLPLDPAGGPTPFTVVFENGVCTSGMDVVWAPFNLLSASTSLVARAGDMLRVAVAPEGAAQGSAALDVSTNGVLRYSVQVAPGSVIEVPFDVSGNWSLSSVWTGADGQTVSRISTVAVYSAKLPAANPACVLGRARAWDCPGVTPGTVLQSDPGVALEWNGAQAAITVNRMYADHFVVARAGAGGPVLDSRRIEHFWLQSAVDSFVRVVEKRETSQVWEGRLVSLGVPGSVRVELQVFVGGVTFDDLSIVRNVDSAIIGGDGDYLFRLIHPNSAGTSVCHTIKAWQGGVFLGEAYYALIGLPEDLR